MEYETLKFGIYAPVSSNMHFLSGGVSDCTSIINCYK